MTALVLVAVLAYLVGWANAAAFSLWSDDEPIEYQLPDEWNGGLL